MNCRLCEEILDFPALTLRDLPSQSQYFVASEKDALLQSLTLDLYQCINCGLVQISAPPISFYKEVIRSTHYSSSFKDYRKNQISKFLENNSLWNAKLIEVGSGYGDFLEVTKELGIECRGIEFSRNSCEKLEKLGHRVSCFFPLDLKTKWDSEPFDAFFSFNVLEHVPRPVEYLRKISENLKEDAAGIVEVPNFDLILQEEMLSEFMLEHLSYFSKETLYTTLVLSGFEIISLNPTWHNYILSAEVRKKRNIDWLSWEYSWRNLALQVQNALAKYSLGEICIWGAGHQALAAIKILGVEKAITYVVDASPNKQGRFTPASGKRIVPPELLFNDDKIKCVLVIGGSYSDEIISVLKERKPNMLEILYLSGNKLIKV